MSPELEAQEAPDPVSGVPVLVAGIATTAATLVGMAALCMVCNDMNVKGGQVPLAWAAPDQAAEWFHPYWRSASGKLRLDYGTGPRRRLTLTISAKNAGDAGRVSNFVTMVKLKQAWGDPNRLEAELQTLQSRAVEELISRPVPVTQHDVVKFMNDRADSCGKNVGREEWAIRYEALYRFMAADSSVVADTLAMCSEHG